MKRSNRLKPVALLWRLACAFVLLWMVPHAAIAQSVSMTLMEALNAAEAHSPAIGAAKRQREAAEAGTREVASELYPQLSLAAGFTRHQEPNVIVPIHKVGVFPPLDDQIYETSIQLRQSIFNGGRTRARKRAAEAGVLELRAQEDQVRIDLVEGVAQIFILAREQRDRADLIAARIRSLQRRQDELSLLLSEGRVSPADIAQIAASAEAARADSIEAEGKRSELAIRLGQLIGGGRRVYPTDENSTAANNTDFEEEPLDPQADDSLQAGPRAAKARAQVARATALHSLATRSIWPDISGFASRVYRTGGDLDPSGEWAAGIALRLPLFEGGRRLASRKAAKASMQGAQYALRSVEEAEAADRQIALEQQKSAHARRQYIAAAARSKSRSVAATQELYQAGRVPLSELLVQETDLLNLQIQERGTAYAETMAILRYYAVAGRLTAQGISEIVRRER
jgi:outer membrane protein TolC